MGPSYGGGMFLPGMVKSTPIKNDTVLYQIQFKMEYRYFIPSPLMTDQVFLHDFVIVEAEKGEDLGIMVQFITFADFKAMKGKEKSNSDKEDSNVIRRMKRLATLANNAVRNELRIPLQIVNAEYSFDHKKLFIYYVTDSRQIDFKGLISKTGVLQLPQGSQQQQQQGPLSFSSP
eukprot:gene36570-45101_t